MPRDGYQTADEHMLYANILILSAAPTAVRQGRPAVVALIIGGGIVLMAVVGWLFARRAGVAGVDAERAPLAGAVVRAPSADVRSRSAAALAMPEVDEEEVVDAVQELAESEPETTEVPESPASSEEKIELALDASAVEPLPSPLPVVDDDGGGDLTVLLRRQV